MIRVSPVREPSAFDARVRRRGQDWLAKNTRSQKRPPDYWSEFTVELEHGFGKLCGYAAMFDPTGGTVDHYKSIKNYRELAYEWSNYRFSSAVLNAMKKNADDSILDPYEVEEGWFEILLPSLIMRATDTIPVQLRSKAEYTLNRLQLRQGERILRWRQSWYELYLSGEIELSALRKFAPLIACAIEKENRKNRASGSRSTYVQMQDTKAKLQRKL